MVMLTKGDEIVRGSRGMACVLAVSLLVMSGGRTMAQGAPPHARRHHHSTRRACGLLLPRARFPAHLIDWASRRTAANVGAVASGFQQVHYYWGYILVTPDVYPSVAAAQRRFQQMSDILHDDHHIRIPLIGQQTAVKVIGDQLTGYTVTTILLRVGRTVAEINVGAGGPVVNVAAGIARSVSAYACR